MGDFSAIDISASGLAAQRRRLDIVAENIANAETTRSERGGPYRRKQVVFEEIALRELGQGQQQGVKVREVAEDPRPPHLVYRPGHPDADANGYVAMPNVNIVEEMVDMISATRSYEANATALEATKTMARKALELGRR
jgi:flagellar basal-body rod protein FlgC